MPNLKDAGSQAYRRILVAGPNGSGKSSLIWSLPGRKFIYIFDPNAFAALQGLDADFEAFQPDPSELDLALKGFNKGAKDDKIGKVSPPTAYNRFVEHWNKHGPSFEGVYDWIVIDSLTFLTQACMKRQLYINGRQGGLEDRGDYRVVGNSLSDLFTGMAGLDCNIYMTAHLQTYQDEKTAKIDTQLRAPGSGRDIIPLVFSDIWLANYEEQNGKGVYTVRTVPEARGWKNIRTSLRGLDAVEDVTIPRFDSSAEAYGIGRLLKKAKVSLNPSTPGVTA